MSFINFNNRTATEAGTYSARMIAEALYQVETKNINKIKSLVESIKEPLATAEALNLFKNKLVALNALQTAAANAMPVNEGQFSWMAQDTGEQIGSERENRITVYMYDNEGNQYKEDKYDGYGEFGGMDYYELLARMNGYTEEDLEEVKGPFKEMRQLGIDLAFGKLKTKDKGRKILYPALVTDPRYNWKKHDFTQEAESDPDQSWYVEPDYDEEYYEAQKIEEAKSIAKIQKEWAKVTAMMKDTVDEWKAAEGQEKEDLLTQLKTLTISKKKLEVELDDAVGLKDADAELVGEAKNEIKYYKTISKKDWEKAPKDYKSTIDGEHYMMFLDDKLGSILAPVKVEEAYNEGLNWDSLIEKVKNTAVNEWGSSDQNIMNKAIHKDAGSPRKMPSPFDSKLIAAAEDAVDFYWDDWEEYETDRQGLIDKAIRGYLRSYFRKNWDLLVKMFEPVDENTETFNFSEDEVRAAANLIAKAIAKIDKVKTEVHHLEYDKGRGAGFDISIDGEESAGGSYVVKDNGDIVNAAIGNSYPNAVYAKIGDKNINRVIKNVKKFESLVTEAKYDKKKLLKLIKNQDDAEILVNGKWYIIYNPDNGNDENTEMWAADDYIYALDPDGEEYQIKYKDIEQFKESVEVNEADMNDPVLMAFRAARTKREKELAKPKRKPLYGKQREKAEDDLWQISQDLKDLYADRGQMLIDMEQEAEVEGGPIADEYGDKLNKIEDEIQKLIAKRSKLEMRLAESFINEEEDYSDEMSYGQLESCIDNANMIRDRIDSGVSLDAWMHSQIAVAKNELTSVFDAIDGDDGVVEKFELTEGVMSDIHQLASKVKDEEEFVKQFFKEYGAKVKKNPESVEWVKSLYTDTVEEAVVNEAKKLDRDDMMIWLEDYLDFIRTTEEFDGAQGGIWVSGENGDMYKGKRIYDYYNEDSKKYSLGVLTAWEKELNKRGWYSEWYDAGTVMIWPN